MRSYNGGRAAWKGALRTRAFAMVLPPLLHAVWLDVPRFTAGARASMRELWSVSVTTGRETVACLGGRATSGGFEIDRIQPLRVAADSLRADAMLSLERCRPPAWTGTVHTHPHDSPLFKDTFSPSDRAVFARWRQRWRAGGAFCVLYSAEDAYCTIGTHAFRLKYSEAEGIGHRSRVPADMDPTRSLR